MSLLIIDRHQSTADPLAAVRDTLATKSELESLRALHARWRAIVIHAARLDPEAMKAQIDQEEAAIIADPTTEKIDAFVLAGARDQRLDVSGRAAYLLRQAAGSFALREMNPIIGAILLRVRDHFVKLRDEVMVAERAWLSENQGRPDQHTVDDSVAAKRLDQQRNFAEISLGRLDNLVLCDPVEPLRAFGFDFPA